jgi:hypothetical protein
MAKLLLAFIASLIVASCTAVRTNVAVTHTLPASASARTVAILPYTEGLAAAPEFRAYAAKLAAHLRAEGYDVVEPAGGRVPDYLAFFSFRIDDGTAVTRLASTPHPFTGSIITYGYRTAFSASTRRIYSRTVMLDILDRARFRPNEPASFVAARLYSGSVLSEGSCPSLDPVIDPMLAALFADFPGASGQGRAVDIPAESACGLDRFG